MCNKGQDEATQENEESNIVAINAAKKETFFVDGTEVKFAEYQAAQSELIEFNAPSMITIQRIADGTRIYSIIRTDHLILVDEHDNTHLQD